MSKPVDVRNKLADKALELFEKAAGILKAIDCTKAIRKQYLRRGQRFEDTFLFSVFRQKGLDYVDHARRFSGKQY